MLLSIIGAHQDTTDNKFKSLLECIKEAYWPARWLEDNKQRLTDRLPQWPRPLPSDEAITQVENRIRNLVTDIPSDKNKFYTAYEDGGATTPYEFPFTDHLFAYFVQRKYSIPYRDPSEKFEDLFRLQREDGFEKLSPKEYQEYNYSKNYGDFHHFLNVVLATARLIEFFSDIANFAYMFQDKAEADEYGSILRYNCFERSAYPEGTKRCLLLMIAAFYHDLGKTIVYPRHAMEGSVLIANHTTRPVFLINEIFTKTYNLSFDTEDLIFISNLVYYHDQFGTLGTGEAGYPRLVDLLHRMKRFAYRGPTIGTPANFTEMEKQLEKETILRSVFDLWILNLADMMVSIPSEYGNKLKLQDSLFNSKSSTERIKTTLATSHPRNHDFHVAISLANCLCEKHHSDDLSELESKALTYARRHAVERIFRLLRAVLIDFAPHYKKNPHCGAKAQELLDEMRAISNSDWHAIIGRSITFNADFSEFVHRFAWVGQLDYSFSFFQRLAERALQLYEETQRSDRSPNSTGDDSGHDFSRGRGRPLRTWIYSNETIDFPGGFLLKSHARFFAENFSAILVQILHHLLFREREFDRLINFEFRDASDRLTTEKIDRILSIEGPYRAKRAVELALEGIFFFK